MPETPILNIQNIHKRFGDLEVLHGLSLQANKGDVISLIGSSGSGKSTFLRCINLLDMPDKGDISLNGETIQLSHNRRGERHADKPAELQAFRAKIAMVFQQFNLWSHMTILQNVAVSPMRVLGLSKSEANDLALAYLDKVGIADKASSYPSFLSGGQQQRVAIARALAMRPEVILFDEPTSALDPELVGEVLNVMQQLADDGTTMIVVTHEMKFARDVSNKALFLHMGQIEEMGAPSQLFGTPTSPHLQRFLSRSAM